MLMGIAPLNTHRIPVGSFCKIVDLKKNIPALGRQRNMELCEFEDSLDYKVSSRIA